MERLHANRRQATFALRVVLIAALAGCSNRQMSASNPFMAPDRVPPPATRTIAPGTAAPYYPGDPVPAAQNPTPAAPILAQAPPTVAPTTPTVPSPPPSTTAATGTPLAGNQSVAIPSDNEQMRFALPAPPPIPQPQPQPQSPAAASIASSPVPASAPQVIPAAYNQPVATQVAPVPATAANDTNGPWRSPQVPHSQPVAQAQYMQSMGQPPQQLPSAPAAPTMPVELRAVPSSPSAAPTTQPTAPADPNFAPPPRMRFPSWASPSTWFAPQPAAGQQLIGYMVPGPDGTMHMVSVDQMQAMSAGTAPSAPAVASSDGFRPRGSTTK